MLQAGEVSIPTKAVLHSASLDIPILVALGLKGEVKIKVICHYFAKYTLNTYAPKYRCVHLSVSDPAFSNLPEGQMVKVCAYLADESICKQRGTPKKARVFVPPLSEMAHPAHCVLLASDLTVD